ncbi:hypothetical protein [Phytobacter diazotrophicus]|uniref:hypothetical protein n=1 Tax=Phytobacter diazotrophicus TaxID=395631 RepID=UPI00290F8485|nr:hypothetical protein [Enterobacteriaceae bacterium]
MDVKADIIAWLLKQQDWFQDLAERLIQQGGLTENDLQQVVDLLKTPQGQTKTTHRTFPGLTSAEQGVKWFTEFGHLNRGDMLTSEHYRCLNEKKKFQRRV